MDNILTGNFHATTSPTSDWVMGFNKEAVIQNSEVGLKWSHLVQGDDKITPFANTEGTTLSILFSGKIRIVFPDLKREVILEKEGDYVFIPPNIFHTRETLADAFVISLRWPATKNDQIEKQIQ